MQQRSYRRQTTILWPLCLLLVCVGTWNYVVGATFAMSPLRQTPVVRAVAKAAPSVVNIHGRKIVPDGQAMVPGDATREVNGMGTGVVIDERGYIITNYHVVDGVARIQVSTDGGKALVARLIAHDPKTDLAIIKVDSESKLPVISIGTSSDLMRGEPVVAVGNAYGYDHTVTRGIISALNRPVQVSDEQHYDGLIQTDASINPGNSGGPLLNIEGKMIGINVAVRVGAQGIGFAIPVDEAVEVAAHLLTVERVDNLTHGVYGSTRGAMGTTQFVVESLGKQSPAEKSGLQAGDIITSVDNHVVQRGLDFERALIGHAAGEEVRLKISRNGESLTVDLALAAARPMPNEIGAQAWETLGLRLSPVSQPVFRQYNTRYRGGLKVVEARGDGPGARQGIRRGDVLVGMHKWETISMENVSFILNSPEFEAAQPVKFYILRGNETLYGQMRVAGKRRR